MSIALIGWNGNLGVEKMAIEKRAVYAYFDDSGKESDQNVPYVCMAGYLADQSYWEKFAREWLDLLRIHNISQIHMRELVPLQSEYRHLGWDAHKRDRVLADFIRLIKENQLIGFAVGVDAHAWRDIRKRYMAGNVQTFCFARTMKMVVNCLKKARERDVTGLVLDTDKEFASARRGG